jgi:hypothetical protein
MALFDQFGPAQANNGQAPPSPQATSGAPGFPFGSWGNQPPNMAGGLQQFLAARGMARPQGPVTGAPAGAGAPPGAQPGMVGAPQPGGPQMSTGFMPQPGQGAPAAVMPQGASATSPTGNFASQMQPFLGARR